MIEAEKITPPPPPSTPKRAPWEEVEQLTQRLDKLISLMETGITGVAPPTVIYGVPGAPGEAVVLPVPVGYTIGRPPNAKSWRHGQMDVVTTNKAVRLMEQSIPIQDGYELTIIAKPDNSGTIKLGKSAGDAQESQQLDGLSPGLAIGLPITNVNKVWFTGTAGDGVSWFIPIM